MQSKDDQLDTDESRQTKDGLRYFFCKRYRLLSSKEFDYVFAKPRKIVSPQFVLFYRISEQACARLGIIVAKKRIRKAVNRNQIKRVIRESFRNKLPQLVVGEYVLVARSTLSQLNKTMLREHVDQLWDQSKKLFATR